MPTFENDCKIMKKNTTHIMKAPSPRGHFLLGNAPAFKRDALNFITENQAKYGDIFAIRLGPQTAHVVCHPEMIEQILIEDNQSFDKIYAARKKQGLALIFGEGLLVNVGESWQRQRRLIQPIFHRSRIAGLADKMTAATERLLKRWETELKPEMPIEINQEMMRLTLEIIYQTMFSSHFVGSVEKIRDSLTIALRYAAENVKNPISLPLSWPTPRNRKFKQAMQTCNEILYELIDERKKNPTSDEDLLNLLLQAHDESTPEGMNKQQLRDEIGTIFLAGHETTANALTWTWYILAQFPEINRKMRAEIATVLKGRPPTVADLPHLRYTRQVLEESLRLYPPAPIVIRRVMKDTSINGYNLATGTKVFLSIYHVHRHPQFWDKPKQFMPERFDDKNKQHRCAYMPFGAGPYVCIGRQFALMEAQLILAQIAQKYAFHLVPDQSVEPEVMVTLRPRHGIKMILEPVSS
jgi:cytochrome P450